MNDEELLTEIVAQNPWWREKGIKIRENIIERSIFSQLKRELERSEATVIVGLRRVGKTTLLKQLMDALLKGGVKPERILYFSFDAMKKEENIIKRMVSLYFHGILHETHDELKEKAYLFFDEVQKIKEWGEEIKSLYDRDLKIKFVASGSSSMNILKGSGESLLGRSNIFKIHPFSFREFLLYSGLKTERIDLKNIKYPLQSEKIKILFDKYMKLGGFPELYETEGNELKSKIKTIVDMTFYRDIVNIFEIKRSDVLEGLFYSFVKESGNIINYSNLSNSLKTKFETLKSYIEYLNSSFLISKSYFFSNSKIKSFEKNVKIYVSDHSFSIIEEIEEGLKVETTVFNHCKTKETELFYWQDKNKNEADILFKEEKSIKAIEVKYKGKITESELKGLLGFLEKYKQKEGIVITKNILEKKNIEGKEILFVPAWLFLLSF